ncbi:MAG: ABC transporter permease subunit, partial [Myxococcales bacterium]|nr:ABC transporter permease subunit [Myxococcales bacterium]
LPSPNESDFSLPDMPDGGPPTASSAHWLGVDALFRDELARLAAGARVSLGIAVLASGLATLVGVAVGIAAASARRDAGWLDGLLMRVVDVLLAFPFLLLVTAIGVLVGRTDVPTMILVLGLTGFPGLARIVRARALVVLEADYIAAARALGASRLFVARKHVLPNVMATAIALFTSLVGSMILAESVLGYLTVGLPPPDASWGRMLHEAESLIVQRPLLVAAPATCILLASLGFHRLGEALAELAGAARRSVLSRFPFPLDIAVVGAGLGLLLALPRAELAEPLREVVSGGPQRGGVLRLATAYSIHSLDPALAADEGATITARMIFGRLVDLDEQGRFVPGLSTGLAWSEDGRTLRITLRKDVIFQDGTVLTADAAKRSIERALAPDVPSPGAHNYAGIVGFSAYRDGKASSLEGVLSDGDHVLVIKLEEPNGVLPSLLSLPFVAPVCPSTPPVARTRDLDLCGAGPFKVRRFDPEQGVLLTRNPHYYEPDLPYLDGIEQLFNIRPQAQRHRFEQGQLDFVRELSSSDAALFRADPRYRERMHLVENMRTSAIFMNTERPPFDNAALRRAVSFAVDPSVLARLRPDVLENDRVVPAGVPGRPEGVRGRVHDPARALAAMAEAGYPYDPETKRGGYPEEIEYVTVPDSFEQAAAEIYQQQLARIG